MKKAKSGFLTGENLPLLTDLYQLTMGQVYLYNQKNDSATFDLFIRNLPEQRGYLVAAGLEQAVYYLETLRFGKKAVDYLRNLSLFSEEYLKYLSTVKFTGSIDAMPEGTPVFENEPILRVTAPRIEAQLVETCLLNIINHQTLIASKAARVVDAAGDSPVIEFGLRRAPGLQSGIYASRSAYIAGCAGTSNVAAGFEFGIPVRGTMAHALVLSFDSETEAFEAYSRQFPHAGILLIDTYDTVKGARNAVKIKERLKGVRLDSGDKDLLSREVKQILLGAGLADASIFVSDDMNEYKITTLVASGAPIDAYGVGTEIVSSKDAPVLNGVYKLAQDSGGPKMKLSENKATLPGIKQVVRVSNNGKYEKDIICLEEEHIGGTRLLVPVMHQGKLVYDLPDIEESRQYALRERAKLPETCRKITGFAKYPVEISAGLQELIRTVTRKIGGM